jgi:hypothetical protein
MLCLPSYHVSPSEGNGIHMRGKKGGKKGVRKIFLT